MTVKSSGKITIFASEFTDLSSLDHTFTLQVIMCIVQFYYRR